jgi:hypothetical protein
MVTYLLHTSHAGKNGSRAGLGLSLIQFGLYVRSRKCIPLSVTHHPTLNYRLTLFYHSLFLQMAHWTTLMTMEMIPMGNKIPI